MKRYFLLVAVFSITLYAKNIDTDNNIWLKTYQNYKNYNTIISNISKIEYKIKNTENNIDQLNLLYNKLNINRSKLSLYEKNRSFDNLLIKYKFEVPQVTLREYFFKNTLKSLDKLIDKYIDEKNSFYLAKSTLQNLYNLSKNDISREDKKLTLLSEDIEYFNDYSENIEKVHQNLLETRDELNKKYEEYKDEVLIKHILTLATLVIIIIFYKLLSRFLKRVNTYDQNHERYKSYNKLLSLAFFSTVFIFIIIRYIDDLLYIITFLSVIAAALTIATREIILNIAGAVYIFFSSVIRAGDRIMVQFETKHTVGDVLDISLVKIKLQELGDYNNIKEIKNAGRIIYIPNSYVFTKVFYNYSLKKNGLINDIIEFEFDSGNDFEYIKSLTADLLEKMVSKYKINFSLNSLKTAVLAVITYETNYKEASSKRGEISIKLFQAYKNDAAVKLKSSKASSKTKEDEGE